MKSFIAIIFLLVSACPLIAGQSIGYIDSIIVRDSDGLVYFTLKNEVIETAKPACATKTYWMIRDENSKTAEYQISQLLAAQMAGKKVTIYGHGACTRWGDGEDVNTVRVYAQ
ncbi:MAG: hypothetical protein HWE27_10530 [Gammaproteobacteria bacterium]|nr:hypothetical protein [Gammaproteobacteria bacterium]